MDVFNFNYERHSSIIKEWLKGHQLDVALTDQIPRVGCIVKEIDQYYAAGFLRRIESCDYVLLDGLIANPQFSGKKRYRALDMVVEELIRKAKEMKFKKIMAFSLVSATLKRSVKHGFLKTPHVFIIKDL